MKLKTLVSIICQILDCCPNPENANQANAFFSVINLPENKIEGDIKKMQLREGQKVTATVDLKTARGNQASYEKGSASWESSDESVVSVEQNPENELEATIRGLDGDENGSVVITFRADGDDTESEKQIVATLDVVCTQGKAVVASVTTGAAEDDTEETE